MRKIYLSLGALEFDVATGRATADDLGFALYYLSCRRSAALSERVCDSAGLAMLEKEVRLIVRQVLLTAESEGRAILRNAGDLNSYRELNRLLAENGYVELPVAEEDLDGYGYGDGYIEIGEWFDEMDLPLVVAG